MSDHPDTDLTDPHGVAAACADQWGSHAEAQEVRHGKA